MERVDDGVIADSLYRIGNQIFKLLPMREEGKDWKKPLETTLIEVIGLSELNGDNEDLYSLACKMRGLYEMIDDLDIYQFRRAVFECCSLAGKVRSQCQCEHSR